MSELNPPAVPDPGAAGLPGPIPAGYPVTFDVEHQAEYSRLMPLVKWLLAIPHYIVLSLLAIVALFVILISFFAVLITGRYPRGMWDFMVGFHRWALRVAAYVLLMTDKYPAFALKERDDDQVWFNVEYPEQGVNRWRPLVHWLLILPYAFVVSLLINVAFTLSFFALFTILFTKRFPEGMFDINRVVLQWQARSNIYSYWMVDRYPPFEWE